MSALKDDMEAALLCSASDAALRVEASARAGPAADVTVPPIRARDAGRLPRIVEIAEHRRSGVEAGHVVGNVAI
jgi:hypothetical protein